MSKRGRGRQRPPDIFAKVLATMAANADRTRCPTCLGRGMVMGPVKLQMCWVCRGEGYR